MSRQDRSESLRCSFCGKSQTSVAKLIAGPANFICSECIELCNEIIADNPVDPIEPTGLPDFSSVLKPAQLKAGLDQYVIDQDRAKKVLAVAVYNHFKRIFNNLSNPDVKLEKSNVLLLGPSGCGKTLLVETLAMLLDLPFVSFDATTLTQAGYVGENVESILARLYEAADGDLELAERGIVYIDEVDKVRQKSTSSSSGRDPSGEGVQQALLKILEGTRVKLPSQPGDEHSEIDTSNILFICGGAFVGLDEIVEARTSGGGMGFGAPLRSRAERERATSDLLSQVQPQDLVQFGMIPELVGRTQVIAPLEALGHDALVRILVEPKNAIIKQYQYLLRQDGIKLTFTDQALQAIARKIGAEQTGARSLRRVMESLMEGIMFDAPSLPHGTEVVITAAVAQAGSTARMFEQAA